MLLLDVAERFIQFNVYNKETAQTIRGVCSLFDTRSGIVDTKDINVDHVTEFKQKTLLTANFCSFNAYLGYLKLIARWGAAEGLVDASNIIKLRKAPEPPHQPKNMNRSDLEKVLYELRKHPDLVPASWFWVIVIRLFYNLGLRRRQLVELNYEDIDFDRKILKASSRGSKTLRSWDIPLTPHAMADLQYLIESIEIVLGRPIKPHERVCNVCYFNKRCTPDPADLTRMRPDYLTKIMGKISSRTGVKIGAHRIRHTTATALCNPDDPTTQQPDIFFAQHVLGHTDIRTTRLYVKTTVDNRHEYMSSALALK